MKSFSIKQIEAFTGVKAHTIRAWEQRYSFFKSKRTESNIRYFTLNDLNILLKVCFLHKLGYKLQQLNQLSQEEINHKVNSHILENIEDNAIQKLIFQTIQLEIDKVEETIEQLITQHPFEHVLTQILWPFLNKIGVLWNTTVITPRHENMVNEIIKRKLYSAIDKLSDQNRKSKKTALLFCVENEFYDLPLLSIQYLLLSQGFRVINLGRDLPITEIQFIKHRINPDLLILHGSNTSCKNKTVVKAITNALKHFPDSQLVISGQDNQSLDCIAFSKDLHIIQDVHEIKTLCNELTITQS